ncbi:hypothetical protein BH10ACT2_BH10ACT2_00060 [soil metagenome]
MSSPDLIGCTVVAFNYIPRARIVADSFAVQHPGCPFYIVVTDYPVQVKLRQRDDARLVSITDIDFGAEGFEQMATFYDVTEFATAVKPFAVSHFLRDAECVVYLDPDIEVFGPLDPLVEATKRAGISLTPHCLQPMARDGRQPSEAGIMMAGVYNLGYIGVARGAEAFLDWWSVRLRRDAITDPGNHIFTDQRWIDLCIPLFQPHIETSPAYNVAYWNLDQRRVTRADTGQYLVNDEPLRFFHFSGYNPQRPYWISKHQPLAPRALLSESPVLAELFTDYGSKLLALTPDEPPAPYGWSQAIPGLTLTDAIRRCFRDEVVRADSGLGEMPPSPFRPGGAREFVDWLARPPGNNQSPIPRYMAAIWSTRFDVQQHTPEAAVGDLTRLRQWVRRSGSSENDMLALLGWLPDASAEPVVPWHESGKDDHGVNLVGYLHAELGVGQSARLTTAALRESGVPVATVSTNRTLSRQQVNFAVDNVARYDTVVMGVNADQIGIIQADLGKSFMADRYVIGQWYWELERFPAALHPAFAFVNEVWAASAFIRDSIAKTAPREVPVVHMPIALAAPAFAPEHSREALGLPAGFMFLFMWDMLSVLERKNPHGVIAAYREAFAASDGALLVLKTMHGRSNLQNLERLKWSCRDRPDIIVIDEVFDELRMGSLVNLCDCYISLHRSEGFGLTMAEAMLLAKPVIATGYSGNLDFMAPDIAHLVRWEPVAVGKHAAPYRSDSTWADPDLVHAAELMQVVANDQDAARQLGAAARLKLLDTYSLKRRGAAMLHRLEEIWSQ